MVYQVENSQQQPKVSEQVMVNVSGFIKFVGSFTMFMSSRWLGSGDCTGINYPAASIPPYNGISGRFMCVNGIGDV